MAHELRPQSKSDMMAWSRHEALQYTLDFQASILYELSATCDMADVLGISTTNRLFDQVRDRTECAEWEAEGRMGEAQGMLHTGAEAGSARR